MRTKSAKWEEIRAARELLDLDRSASLEEIKQAYRRKAKAHHPDLAAAGREGEVDGTAMPRLTAAYQTLTDYCCRYRIPLEPDQDSPVDAEDWWMQRFGNDPLWGKGKG